MCHLNEYVVVRTKNKIPVDICFDDKQNQHFASVAEAAALATKLEESAKMGEDFIIFKSIA